MSVLWKLVPEQLDETMREVMAKIEDGPRRDHDEVWAEILAAAPTRVIAKDIQEELQELRDERHNWVTSMPAAIQRYHDRADRAELALHEIAHLPDNAELIEATQIALRALPLIADTHIFQRQWCAWCGGTCECDEDPPDDLSDGLPHLNRNE
jgi:hypothetical protein